MITRDPVKDIEHAEPLSALSDPAERTKLADSSMVWHALWLPPGLLAAYAAGPQAPKFSGDSWSRGAVVFTGHINCHDCVLCTEAGSFPHEGWVLVPWRRVYGDCTDDPDEEDSARVEARPTPGDDDLSCIPDPVVGFWRPDDATLRALRLGIVNPAPGVYLPAGVAVEDQHRDQIDAAWMGSPAGSAGRLTAFTLVADTVAGGEACTAPCPDELRAWLEAPGLSPGSETSLPATPPTAST